MTSLLRIASGKGGSKTRAFKEYSPAGVLGAAGVGIAAPFSHLIPSGVATVGAGEDQGSLKAASRAQPAALRAE